MDGPHGCVATSPNPAMAANERGQAVRESVPELRARSDRIDAAAHARRLVDAPTGEATTPPPTDAVATGWIRCATGGGVAPEPLPARSGDASGRRVLTPLTAFTEMAVLEREGRAGWHVVDYGPLFHVVEASDVAWEHRRVLWAPGVARRMAADGWTLIRGATFPWGYYKRPAG